MDGTTPGTLKGVWKRVDPDGTQLPDGQGLIAYSGQSTFVVKKIDLSNVTNLSAAQIDREGDTWSVRYAESQDEWTWILHLSRRKAGTTNPKR
jgi:hypothetical protein